MTGGSDCVRSRRCDSLPGREPPALSAGCFSAAAPETFGSFGLRAVGGGPLEGARLFRSRQLAGMTAAEADGLAHGLGVRAIYDIRGQREVLAAPEPYVVGTKTIQLTPEEGQRPKSASQRLVAGVIGEYGAPEERMRANYRRYVQEYPLMGTALRSIAAEGVPALIHCVNGKDRTGVLSALIMVVGGAHPDDIMADYLATNQVNAAQIAEEAERLGEGMTPYERAILLSFLEARPSYLAAFFDEVARHYGSLERYLVEGVRITAPQLAQLQELYGR